MLAIVGGIVFAGLWKLNIPADAPATDAPVPATAPAKIVAGRDYYVLVKLVEFNPRKPNGRIAGRARRPIRKWCSRGAAVGFLNCPRVTTNTSPHGICSA